MEISTYPTQTSCLFSIYTTADVILCSHLTFHPVSVTAGWDLLNKAHTMHAKIRAHLHRPQPQLRMRQLRGHEPSLRLAAPHTSKGRAEMVQHTPTHCGLHAWHSHRKLIIYGTSPTSTPAKRSGPTPTRELCMLR